jgi:hypothetical protein
MTCVGVASVFGNMFGDCGGEIAISFRLLCASPLHDGSFAVGEVETTTASKSTR